MRNLRALLIILVGIAIADIGLKAFTHLHLPLMSAMFPCYPYGGIPVFYDWLGIDFSLNHVVNHGAAWGVFGNHAKLLLVFRILMIVAMGLYLGFYNKKSENRFPLALILTGASLNVLDYFVYGHVVDMFLFNFWGYSFPLFNIADASICCGVGFLILYPLFTKNKNGIGTLKEPHA